MDLFTGHLLLNLRLPLHLRRPSSLACTRFPIRMHRHALAPRDRTTIARLTVEVLSLYRESNAMTRDACDVFLAAAQRMPKVHTVVRRVFKRKPSARIAPS